MEVCVSPSMVSYSFGLVGQKADLAISVPKASASGFRWDGITRFMTNSINIANGTTEYRIYHSLERDPNGTDSSGVHVVVNGKRVADVACDHPTTKSELADVDVKAATSW